MVNHSVWLYVRFSLSYRNVELMMTERSLTSSFETVRQWCGKF